MPMFIDSVSTKKFHSVFIEKYDQQVNTTSKQLDFLQQLANSDKSIKELAYEFCIAPITAHQHISGARKALGVKTNIGGIVKAIKTGLIRIN